jgi:HEAT repeat protein
MLLRSAAVLMSLVWAAVLPLAADEKAQLKSGSKSGPQEKLIKDLRTAPLPAARIKAAESLGAEGANGQWAAADLCAVMLDRNPKVRKAATEALQKIDPQLSAIAVPLIVDESRETGVEQLLKVCAKGDVFEALSPIVLYRFRQITGPGGSPEEAEVCLQALFECGRRDKEIVEVIANTATKSKMTPLRARALGLLPELGIKDSKRVVTILTAALKTDCDANKLIAMQALVKLEKPALAATDALRKLKGSPNTDVRKAADETLKAIDELNRKVKDVEGE